MGASLSGTVYGVLRVGRGQEDLAVQRGAVSAYAAAQGFDIDHWQEVRVSSKKMGDELSCGEFLNGLHAGDTVVVARLSHLGRALGAVVQFVDQLLQAGVSLTSVHENMTLDAGGTDLQSRIMSTMFALLADTEKDLISQRTRTGLERARAKGKRPGRPKGSFNSRLDGREDEIRALLEKGVSKASVARIMDVSSTAFYAFIKSRKLV